MCVVIGYFVGDQPMIKFVAHIVVRSRKIVLGCWVGHLRPGLFVHTERRGGSTHCFGWLADWSVQLHCCSESSCWHYNFPTFTCARPSKRSERIYTTCVAEILVAVPCCRLMFMTYIFRHCGLLILKMISIQAHRNVERESVHVLGVCVCWTNWLLCLNL